MSNQVVVTLSAKDQISSVVKSVKANIAGIGNGFDGLRGGMGNLSGTMEVVGGGIQGWVAGLSTAVVSLATMLQLANGIKDAMKAEMSTLGASNALSINKKISLSEAQSVMAASDNRIADVAMTLPGEAKDFTAIRDAITAGVGNATTDVQSFIKALEDITVKAGVSKGNVDAGAVGTAINKFLSVGSGWGELKMNDFFEKNAALRSQLEKEMEASGIGEKEFTKLSGEKRMEMLQRALTVVANPEYIEALKKTGAASWGNLSDMLFNPNRGVFGFLREVNGVKGAKTTALKSISTFLGTLGGLMDALKKAGFGFDPMQAISNMFLSFTNFVTETTRIIKLGGDVANNLTYQFTKTLTWSLESLTVAIKKVDWYAMGVSFGENLGKILTDEELGIALEKGLTAAIQGLADLLSGSVRGLGDKFREWTGMDKWDEESALRSVAGNKFDNDQSISGLNRFLGIGKEEYTQDFLRKSKGGVQPSSLPSVNNNNMVDKRQPANVSFVINGADMNKTELANEVLQKMSGIFQEYRQTVIA